MEPKLILLPNSPDLDPHPVIEQAVSHELSKSVTIAHEKSGKPYLVGHSASISISHCRSAIGIYIGEHSLSLGIDVEDKWDQAVRTFSRFATIKEQELLNKIGWLHPLWLWTAKEAVYKAYSDQITHFSKDIQLVEVKKDGALRMIVNGSTPILVQRRLHEWRCAVALVSMPRQ